MEDNLISKRFREIFLELALLLGLLFLFCLFHQNAAFAQPLTKYTLKIHTQDQAILSKLDYPTYFSDSISIQQTLKQIIAQLQKESYWASSVDSVYFTQNQCNAILSIGRQYQWGRLGAGNLEKALIEKMGLEQKIFDVQVIDYQIFTKLKNDILNYLENHGYPFAQVGLDSIQLRDNLFSASLKYDKGTYIRFDTVMIAGEGKVKADFLANYLKIKQNEPFSQQKVREAERMLRSLPYIKLRKPIEVVFEYDRAFIVITLDKIRSSQFDGIVGLLPNQEQRNRWLVTGQVNLKLANLFQTGKRLHLEWQSLRAASQLFNFEYDHPQLFKMNFDINLKFNLLKEDTSFLNIGRSIKFSYQLDNIQRVSFFAKFNTTSVTDGTSTQAVVGQENNRFIRFANTRQISYGLGYEINSLDNFFRPQKGWYIRAEVATGNKAITPRLGRDLGSDTVFRQIDLNSTQWTVNTSIQHFFKIGRSSTFLLRSVTGLILNKQLFMNELIRVGGLNSLRGFNENAFYASRYMVSTAEVRLYFEESSYLFTFVDYGLLAYQIPTQVYNDRPLGAGAGLSFATKGGIFNFAYAMGSSQFQQLAVNQAKIHFGYMSRF